MAQGFTLELVSPERLLLSAQAEQVVVPGSEGDFTVLSKHAPVLATLRPGLLVAALSDGSQRSFFVREGFAEVNAISLTVLAQQAIDVVELDRDELGRQIENAKNNVSDAKNDLVLAEAEELLDRLQTVESTLMTS